MACAPFCGVLQQLAAASAALDPAQSPTLTALAALAAEFLPKDQPPPPAAAGGDKGSGGGSSSSSSSSSSKQQEEADGEDEGLGWSQVAVKSSRKGKVGDVTPECQVCRLC